MDMMALTLNLPNLATENIVEVMRICCCSFRPLGERIGPKSGTDRLLVIDGETTEYCTESVLIS